MDLHRLQHIVSLADEKNFSRAALRANVSQSALSRSIQAAEREFGFELFDRRGTAVTATNAGEFIIERARKLLFESRNLMRDADLYRSGSLGALAVGAGPYSGAVFLPHLLIALRQHFPQVQVRVVVTGPEALLAQLKAEELDFFLGDMRTIKVDADLTVTPLTELQVAFFVRPGHPLLSSPVITPAALQQYGVASVRTPYERRIEIGKAMGLEDGVPAPQAIEVDDLGMLKDIAMRSDTIVRCAMAATCDELAAQRLVRLEVASMPVLYAMLGIVAVRGRTLSPLSKWACDHLQQRASRLPRD